MAGVLYLIPTTLGDTELSQVLPEGNNSIIKELKVFIVENRRTARRFLKQVDRTINIDELQFFELNEHTDKNQVSSYLTPLEKGQNVGILSEAGCPAIADPGADIVGLAQAKDIKVVPLVGPSSILLSLMTSGFNGQNFAFNGYLPIEKGQRSEKITQLERRVYSENQTQLFIETPYRNNQLLEELLKILLPQTKVCVAVDITLDSEYIHTKTVKEWKATPTPELHKRPCIFLIYK
ncbi:MAG TPA: SAM-dependent methyltransferase [Paludibacteraceae bacterium]|nr:SAM-dependent methyltransferase [Paludibacteraceae bacterium]